MNKKLNVYQITVKLKTVEPPYKSATQRGIVMEELIEKAIALAKSIFLKHEFEREITVTTSRAIPITADFIFNPQVKESEDE